MLEDSTGGLIRMDPGELVKIGKIVGTHGYKGSVKVQPLTDFPERFQAGQKYLVQRGKELVELELVDCSPYRGQLLMKFVDVDDLERAATLRSLFLHVTMDQLHPLPPGTYYHFQLIGMQVEDVDRGFLGTLTEVLETGANDVYVVNSDVYGEILLPAINQVIIDIDVPQRRLRVKLLDGMLGES